MAHKIAIITTRDTYSQYGDDQSTIISSITDWTTVTHEEFLLLQQASYKMPYGQQFVLIEQPADTSAFIAKTIADYLVIAKKQEADELAAKKKRADEALARKHKKELKDRDSKLALLKKLQAELGTEI